MSMRIPEAEIDRIKREIDLAALVRSRGIELKPHGSKDLIGRCPFHNDHETPNLIISPGNGLWHCMACGAAGNCIQFIQKFDGVGFRHAFELLKDGPAAFKALSRQGAVKCCATARLTNPFSIQTEDAELFDQVLDYYREGLRKTAAAEGYLRGRGLFSEEAIERFHIGFSDRSIGMRLPKRGKNEGNAIRDRLQRLGILRESGQEHFAGSIILPVFDQQGHVAEMYGRKINNNLRKGTPMHLYLPGPHAGIWNSEALKNPELILCEAPLDALTFWINGIRNVTFIFGTEGFPKYLFEALLEHHVKRVRLAYDADEAGNRAAKRDADRLTAHGIEVFRIKFPWGMDVNEYARKVTPATKSLETAVKSAEWVEEVRDKRKEASSTPSRAPTRAVSSSLLAANKLAASLQREPPVAEAEPLPAKPKAANEKSESEASANSVPTSAGESGRETSSLERQGPSTLLRAGEYHTLQLGQRHYRVGGLDKNNSLEVLKVAVRIRHAENFHLDSFDMTRDGDRRRFIERAAEETGLEKELIKRDLGRLLLALEEAQQQRLNAALESTGEKRPDMTADERAEAMTFLKSPDLVKRIGDAFETCGLVGEAANRLAAYLACTSRKLDQPLAIIIQSSTAAGKTALMDAVLAMFPEEERIKYSAMTGQSLFYLGETDLKHKILAIVEEEGAEKASYALKLLHSEGELTIASTGMYPTSGRMETQEYHVEGPVMIFLTTTAVEIDEELQNRCLMLTVDESRQQTERIHALQRKDRTLQGLVMREERKNIMRVLRNAQRLIQPLAVVNPYADDLTFTTDQTRTRRDNLKYLSLIDAIALLHQHQRARGQLSETTGQQAGKYITVTFDDIELANNLAPELFGRSLDELPPQSRRLLEHIKALVLGICKREDTDQRLALFSRRQLCELSGWTYSQVKRHLVRLQELEYIIPRYGGMGSTMRYELLVSADEPADKVQIGLLDVAKLRKSTTTTTTRTPKEATLTPPCQNGMARLSVAESTTNANLATLPDRTSGALAAIPS